jgi:gluconokinase
MVVILLGVAGAGKTTVGQALAARHGWRFLDADDRHTPDAIAKMRNGVPLTDADREPWLASLHTVVAAAIERREPLVVACSALKQRYRDRLRGTLRLVRFVYLKADEPTLRQRLEHRGGHFAGPVLLASQLADLEEPADALTIDARHSPDQIVNDIDDEFGL